MKTRYHLEGKRTLITGGAQGIGAATAERFLAEDARVVVLDRSVEGLQSIKQELPTLAGTIETDVTDHDAVVRAFNELDDIFGGIDVLINNAGISIRHGFLDITPQDWLNVINVNLTGIFFVDGSDFIFLHTSNPSITGI